MDVLSYDFVRNALLAGLLASVLCGVVGTFIVVKRLVFLSGGLAHAAFAGLGLAFFLGLDPRLGATVVAVLGAILIELWGRRKLQTYDAAIGVVWAVGMAIGILLLHLTPGYAPDLMTYLFGNILTVTRTDLVLLAATAALVLLFLSAFYKELVAVAFDEDYARVQGVPVTPLMTAMMALIGLSVVMLIQVVGIVLVIALLTVPPLIGLALARSFGAVLLLSTSIGAVLALSGVAVSYRLDLPTGPSIVVLGALALIVVNGARSALSRRARPSPDTGN